MFTRSIYFFILLCLMASCKEKSECSKFAKEEYSTQQTDTVLASQVMVYRDTLLNRFRETSIKGLNYKAYHLLYYNAFGNGKSIKIEINHEGCFLTIKCLGEVVNDSNCENFRTKISEEEWNQFEGMIYEFDFWTATEFRENKNVLDGYAILLEGNRPEAAMCNKRTYKLVGRSSPRRDKMEALWNCMDDFAENLVFFYRQNEKR